MTELEKLEKQKKEIEMKIMALKMESNCLTSMLLFRRNDKEEEFQYQISAKGNYRKCKQNHKAGTIKYEDAERWYPFIREKTPEEAVNTLKTIEKEIPDMIESIERLIQKVKEKRERMNT